MFPLGSVLFPHGVLPLRVFEPRYQSLLDACLAGDARFGVVLIERGFEVGGGDERFEVGTVAQIVQVAPLPEGHRLAVTVGLQRLRVARWLPDDPFPKAEIDLLSDPPVPDFFAERVEAAGVLLHRVLALRSEAGHDVGGFDFTLAEDPLAAGYQLCVLAPLPVIDLQGLLETDDPLGRIERLGELLEDEVRTLQQRLAGG